MIEKYKRIIPLEEVAECQYYSELAKLAVIFNHEIVETIDGVWRWKHNLLIDYISRNGAWYVGDTYRGEQTKIHRGSLCLNNLWRDFYQKHFTCEEFMKFYMEIGYSLSGYQDVFGQKEASELQLPYAKTRTENDNPDDYIQTIIDYMIEKYEGIVLKI